VQCRLCVAPDLVAHIDPRRLEQMVTNGLSNASKFTATGVVSVFVTTSTMNP
jgi:hypothetical protein